MYNSRGYAPHSSAHAIMKLSALCPKRTVLSTEPNRKSLDKMKKKATEVPTQAPIPEMRRNQP